MTYQEHLLHWTALALEVAELHRRVGRVFVPDLQRIEAIARIQADRDALAEGAVEYVPPFDFAAHLKRQRDFSEKTWGPGARAKGNIDHIRSELKEIEANPAGLEEWLDVSALALDGAWRAGYTPEQIICGIVAKQTEVEARTWPDWRTADPEKAIEHDRTKDVPPLLGI